MENKQICLANDTNMRIALSVGSLLNLTGIIMSLTIDVKFIILSFIVSGGLLISGIFGWCPMAFILGKIKAKFSK